MRIVLILSLLLFSSCDTVWNRGNRGYATETLTNALVALNAHPRNISCNMVETTRSFTCLGTLDDKSFEKVRNALNLSADSMFASLSKGPCADFAGTHATKLVATSENRPKGLPGLDYLIAAFDSSTGQVCFESSQSYG